MNDLIFLKKVIDLIFLEKFSIGIAVSLLLFLVVELTIQGMHITNHKQRSNLYLMVLLSNFSSILYSLFFFDIHKDGSRLVFVFPNVKMELVGLLRMSYMTLKEGFPIVDLRSVILVLVVFSLSIFFFAVFLSRLYFTKRLHLRRCEDERVLHMVKKICHGKNVDVMVFEGEINAFVFGVPPVLAVSRELLETVNDRELELVLRHEINHIRNYDNILKPFLLSLRVLFFYNPAVHVLSRKIAREIEFTADRVSEVKKERAMFLYTLVRLNELQIGKKNGILSFISSPLVKSPLRIRTETLLSESKRGNPYLYCVLLWLFAGLMVGGVYVSGNVMPPRMLAPMVCGAPDLLCEGWVSIVRTHAGQGRVVAAAIPAERVPPGPELVCWIKPKPHARGDLHGAGLGGMVPTLYSVNAEMVIAAFLLLPLVVASSEYVVLRGKAR